MENSNNQFVVTDIDFQQLQQNQQKSVPSMIKQEENWIPNEEMFYFSPPDAPTYAQPSNNFEVVESVGNTVSIPEGSAFTIPFTDEQVNQLLMGTDENGAQKIDFSALFRLANANSLKTEIPANGATSHFIKYRPDENGKHVKIWECGICHKEFGHQYILMRHLPTHTDERKFQCKQCGKAFRQMSTLSQHRAIHSKLRPYICEICQKTFNRVSTLISHRKTHTGLKPHRCHLCNKAFHQKGNLRNHIFTHTNERPYKCDVCQKGFNQMSNLMCHKFKAHQRADKPKYHCQTCGKEFEKRIGLRNHEQYEHGEPAANTAASNTPSVKYTNGVLVSPINTAAMQLAAATNQVPFALLRPLNGIPVLVRILPAGDNQMLVPATAEDLKKFGEITIKKKGEDGEEKETDGSASIEDFGMPKFSSPDITDNTAVFSGTTGDDKKSGATVQIRIPVVASVVQRCRDGTVHMDIESPGPRREGQECSGGNLVFTTTDQEFTAPDGTKEPSRTTQMRYFELEPEEDDKNKIVLQEDVNMNGGSDSQGGQMIPLNEGMVLDMSTPMINLVNEVHEDVAMDNILPRDMFTGSEDAEIYEIIEATPATQGESVFGKSQDEEYEIRVD